MKLSSLKGSAAIIQLSVLLILPSIVSCYPRPTQTVHLRAPAQIFKRASYIDSSCTSGPYKDIFNTAQTEARNMAAAATAKLDKLAQWLDNFDKTPKTEELTVIRDTFETIFGKVRWDIRGKLATKNKPKNDQAIANIKNLRGVFAKMQGAIGNTPKVDYYCTNDWLLDERPADATTGSKDKPAGIPWSKWDGRKVNNPSPDWFSISANNDKSPGYCSDDITKGNPTLEAVLLPGINSPKGDQEVMLFCDNWLAKFKALDWSMSTIKTHEFQDSDKKTLESFRGGFDGSTLRAGSLSFLLLHELSHSPSTLGTDSTLDSINGQRSYSWSEITAISKPWRNAAANPAGTALTKNANSLVFFMTAMYLDKNNWSTGIAKSLKVSGNGEGPAS